MGYVAKNHHNWGNIDKDPQKMHQKWWFFIEWLITFPQLWLFFAVVSDIYSSTPKTIHIPFHF
jgi:hypothetical protein